MKIKMYFLLLLIFLLPVSVFAAPQQAWNGELSEGKGHVWLTVDSDTITAEARVRIYEEPEKCSISLTAQKNKSSKKISFKGQTLKGTTGIYQFKGLSPNTEYKKITVTIYDPNTKKNYTATTNYSLTTLKKYKAMTMKQAKKTLKKACQKWKSAEVVVPDTGIVSVAEEKLNDYVLNPRKCPHGVIYSLINEQYQGNPSVVYFKDWTTINGKDYLVFRMDNNYKRCKKARKTYKKAKKILKKLKPRLKGKSKKKQAYILTNYIAKTTKYNLHTKDTTTGYGCLCKGSCSCRGYAAGLAYLCNLQGIPCLLAHGDSHAWNYVAIKGKWYAIDPTAADYGKYANEDYYVLKGTGSYEFYYRLYLSGKRKKMHLEPECKRRLKKYYPFARGSLKKFK